MHADVCVIAAGPAGITLAREFVGENFKVMLLEEGRFEFDSIGQSLHDARRLALPAVGHDADLQARSGRLSAWPARAMTWVTGVGPMQSPSRSLGAASRL
jgi:choline dehydrogenase-like flavoprotein